MTELPLLGAGAARARTQAGGSGKEAAVAGRCPLFLTRKSDRTRRLRRASASRRRSTRVIEAAHARAHRQKKINKISMSSLPDDLFTSAQG
jgi:hypothetical protein